MNDRRSYRPPQDDGARRGAGRDLFAVEDEAQATDSSSSALTAERNENSVLFNVNTLRAAMEAQKAEEKRAPAEDNGEIDLRALTSQMGGSLEYKPLALAEPPMAAFLAPPTDLPTESAAKPRGGLFYGGIAAAALVVLGGIATVTVIALGDDPAHAARRTPNERGETFSSLDTMVTHAPEAVADAKPAGGAFRGGPTRGGGKPGAAPPAGGAGGGAAAPPPPKKPSDPCGCKGQLECMMRCSAR
jgi:hypothetical protein